MTKYVQTNEAGYIVSLTNEPLSIGLFGGSSKNYIPIEDQEAEGIEAILNAKHRLGQGLHINELNINTE